jgi:hypothetical protein
MPRAHERTVPAALKRHRSAAAMQSCQLLLHLGETRCPSSTAN